jgi:capsule polysaccharide export protein KpsE/RkpR
MQTPGALFVGVLGSRTVQDDWIDRFDLRKVYNERYWEEARKDLTKNTEIEEDKKSGIISVTVTDTRRERAQKLAEAYAEELNARMSAVASSAARRERIFLEGRLKEEKQELDVSAQAFSQFASKNTAIDIKEQTTAMVDAAAALQGQVIAAQSQLEGLQQIYSPDNYRVRTAKAQIAELQRQLQKLSGSSGPQSPTSDQLYPPIRQLPLLGVEWANLYRRSKIAETVYLLLTREYELAKIEEAKEIPSVRVLDAAQFPEKKASPHRALAGLAALLLSLAAFSGVVIWRQRLVGLPDDDPRKVLWLHAANAFNAAKGTHLRWSRATAPDIPGSSSY